MSLSKRHVLKQARQLMFRLYSFTRYLRALAAMYVRMTFRAVEVYEILEPLLKDYRKLRYRDMCNEIIFSSVNRD